MLEIKDAGYAVGKKWLLQNVSYQFTPGKCYMICGPNGAGKSTLMKLLSLLLIPDSGEVYYNNSKVNYSKKEEYAKYRAVLSQQVDISFPMEVEEVVMMGRYPHFKINPTKEDNEICNEIIALQDLEAFRKRNFLTLSGGEKQRVQFARVLAQIWKMPKDGSRILLLDEPISSLDIKYQFDFLQHVKQFLNDKTIVIAILHDLNLALNYADEIILLNKGKLFASGNPADVLSPQNIDKVFQLNFKLHQFNDVQFLWPTMQMH
ncbi:MAG TPA: heme ABC transporter ATP-binding protein [Ginsengibacter sp.]